MNVVYTHPEFDLLWWDGGYWVKVKDPEGIGSSKLARITTREAQELLYEYIWKELEPDREAERDRGDPVSLSSPFFKSYRFQQLKGGGRENE